MQFALYFDKCLDMEVEKSLSSRVIFIWYTNVHNSGTDPSFTEFINTGRISPRVPFPNIINFNSSMDKHLQAK